MNKQQKEKVKQIADFYGIEKQLEKLAEECEELIDATVDYGIDYHVANEDISTSALIDEMADVKIMIKQLEYLLECEQEVKDRVEFKLNRQIGRMEEERGNY